MIYNNSEKSAFVMGFSYLWKAFLTFSSASQIWFVFFSWYIFQLHNNILRFWHTASSLSLKKWELFNNSDWKTKTRTNKQTKQTFLICTHVKEAQIHQPKTVQLQLLHWYSLIYSEITYLHFSAKELVASIFISTSLNTLPQVSTFPKLPNICGPF